MKQMTPAPTKSLSHAVKQRMKQLIKHSSSLKFAVVIILAIGTLIAWGTIVEARYMDAKMAQETIYHSWFSYAIFTLFAINLTAVIISRYPWQKHHVGFISAHIGILLLLLGSLITRYWGVDGSMALEIGGKNNQITVSETDLVIYTSLNGENFQKYHEQPVNFFRNPPSEKNPLRIATPSGEVVFNDFYHYALVDSKIIPSDVSDDPAAVRFQISNDRVNQSEWLLGKKNQASDFNMGPATVVLTKQEYNYVSGNVLVLKPIDDNKLHYRVFSDKLRKQINEGEVSAGGQFNLGWMNLEFRLLKYLSHAKQDVKFIKREVSSPEAISAVKLMYNGKEQWLGLNSMVRLFGQSEMYIMTYGNRRLSLDFDMYLKKFDVGRPI